MPLTKLSIHLTSEPSRLPIMLTHCSHFWSSDCEVLSHQAGYFRSHVKTGQTHCLFCLAVCYSETWKHHERSTFKSFSFSLNCVLTWAAERRVCLEIHARSEDRAGIYGGGRSDCDFLGENVAVIFSGHLVKRVLRQGFVCISGDNKGSQLALDQSLGFPQHTGNFVYLFLVKTDWKMQLPWKSGVSGQHPQKNVLGDQSKVEQC